MVKDVHLKREHELAFLQIGIHITRYKGLLRADDIIAAYNAVNPVLEFWNRVATCYGIGQISMFAVCYSLATSA